MHEPIYDQHITHIGLMHRIQAVQLSRLCSAMAARSLAWLAWPWSVLHFCNFAASASNATAAASDMQKATPANGTIVHGTAYVWNNMFLMISLQARDCQRILARSIRAC
jgi:hypothetical protein